MEGSTKQPSAGGSSIPTTQLTQQRLTELAEQPQPQLPQQPPPQQQPRAHGFLSSTHRADSTGSSTCSSAAAALLGQQMSGTSVHHLPVPRHHTLGLDLKGPGSMHAPSGPSSPSRVTAAAAAAAAAASDGTALDAAALGIPVAALPMPIAAGTTTVLQGSSIGGELLPSQHCGKLPQP
jgi:hypothetical protein